MDPFAVDVMMLMYSATPRLTAEQIWKRLQPHWGKSMSLSEVKKRMEFISDVYYRWNSTTASRKDLALITSGEHALKLARVNGRAYKSSKHPAVFTKHEVVTSHAVVDVQLVDTKEIVEGIRLDDILLEAEFEKPCCFAPDCIGTGKFALGQMAEPVKKYGLCCLPCFHARVLPQRTAAKHDEKVDEAGCLNTAEPSKPNVENSQEQVEAGLSAVCDQKIRGAAVNG